MDLTNIEVLEVDYIDTSDYPDFVDAFISSAMWLDTSTRLSVEELDILNSEHSDFVYETIINHLF